MVSKTSAVLRVPQETEVAITANHRNMVKFRTQDDAGYKKVREEIFKLVAGALHPEASQC
jgi:hypothetical protein